ncbi:MAG TPA: hypothetical protein VFF67_09950 [Thermoplasmata archaeon]|nr:hypothetical protein [Thermoplasmata archaeon]
MATEQLSAGARLGTFVAILAVMVAAAGTALLAYSSGVRERSIDFSAIVGSAAALSWVYAGGLERAVDWSSNRRNLRAARRFWRRTDLASRLEAFVVRESAVFGPDSSLVTSFEYGMITAENAVFGAIGREPAPTAAEQSAAQRAQAVHHGWRAASSARTTAIGTAREILGAGAGLDSHAFIVAFRLARDTFLADFSAVASYVYEMRQATPYRWQPSLADEWDRIRAEANGFARDWERFGREAGTSVGAEGPYNLRFVNDLRPT